MVKVAVYLIALYLVYSILLSRDTSYGRNRAFILLSLLSSLILPLISLQTLKPWNIQFFGKILSEVFITAAVNPGKALHHSISLPGILQMIYSAYIIVVVIFIFKLIIDVLNLLLLIIRHRSEDSHIIRFHGFNTSGFSAMGYIFVNSKLSNENADEIIRHEQNHLRQNHFLDIVFIEIFKALQWFNPAVYLFNRSLRAIHEYQADQECLSSGIPIVNYQSLLLSQVFKSGAFNLTNSFSNPSLIKKRMVMMTKKRTSALADAKILMVLPVIGVVFMAVSAFRGIPDAYIKQLIPILSTQSLPVESESGLMAPPPPPPPPPPSAVSKEKDQTVKEETVIPTEEQPFVVVEEMPMFPGGDTELLKYISENTRYPENAKLQNLQGKVIIRFCVKADGGVSMASVLRGVSPDLDAEAMRVVNTLPAFKPGKQGGKAVPVWYMVPIAFTLK
jgi:TonB family protein